MDIGPIEAPGRAKYSGMGIWPLYSARVWAEPKPFDVYMVGGFFRICCTAMALLHGSAQSLVLLRGGTENDIATLVNAGAQVVERVETLVVLRRKRNSTDSLNTLWEEHREKYHNEGTSLTI